ncbi:ABC transporter permease [Nonomuraea sp. NN258]|uniref:ABC transporter permease n=1 Tax=Nonomuraea antri TaxID=2730852 RepID=UPI001567F590|nr:ABC transporter permease [Nonomuraea antri]NRQ32735.1 ABC transporter permease [Nonomuraea antri]
MLSIAWSTLRTRLLSFAGTFVALALGAALIAALGQVLATTVTAPDRGPQRYAAAPVVVAADERLTVNTWRGAESRPLAEPRGLPAELVARFPDAVVDRVFPAQLAGGPDAVGRPWSAARTAPYSLVSGRAPASAGEIAVSAGAAAGDRVLVVTASGSKEYDVVGVTTPGPQPAVFFTDAHAARLSPRVDALALWSPAPEVRAAVGAAVGAAARVLTGQDRALIDPNRAADEEARNNANTIVGIAAGFAAFVAVFVVSSTFAFAVGQRRREFALLRTVGATVRQVRRMVYAEAALVAVTASAAGALAGPLGTRPILDWLAGLRMAPAWLVPSTSNVPSWVAFCSGVLVALLGVAVAARRAGRVRPSEAMREAAVEPRAMTAGRWVMGLGVLGTALVSMAVTAVGDPSSAMNNKSFMPLVMLLIAAAGLLAPVVVRPVTRLLTLPVARLRGAGGTVVAAGAIASARQTAATAAPVLVTVALAASLLGGAAMTDAAKSAVQTGPVRADYLVLPSGAAGLDRELVGRLGRIPGVTVTTTTPTSVYTLEGDTALIQRPAEAVEPAALRADLDIPVLSGSLDDLRDDTIVVSETWELTAGQTARMWRADGSEATFKVAAVMAASAPADAYVTAAHAFSARPAAAYVTLKPGTSASTAEAALARATEGHNARAVSKAEWRGDAEQRRNSASRLGLMVVLYIMLAYTVIAMVNTLLMAAGDRAAERGSLRLLGATRGQVLRYVMGEAVLVVAVGVVLAAGATGLSLGGLWVALAQVAGPVAVSLPWATLGALVAGCTALAVLATVIPALSARSSRL